MKIGVLALQGAFREHILKLQTLGVDAPEVRLPKHLDDLDALIIPGGESTTMGKLAESFGLLEPLKAFTRTKPAWGTCAGLILLANRAVRQKKGGQPLIGGLDITVDRNFFGRQVDSFEADLEASALAEVAQPEDPHGPFHAIFIRAPAVVEVGPGVQVLTRLPENGPIVAVREGRLLGTAFHPELSDDLRFHRYFLSMVQRL
ncbi:MAG TPA: pyridoxal 5'-phosphate synthase glutaminase subunit PdxT [Anaerolineae bacterium]|nr:pyridoxal 5'-phosphate synthase glutaminase subunit PdxT [Caldilineae bacterium]HID33900.1 pyridoxal 5'-phosphate synthase glutaminase subunit PdxT [Anaerolineae bacterium]HIQ12026.1 pyridoxal 5'-phosphate synthase glutaminase subunit PdxT [Caldilineales bacterium]